MAYRGKRERQLTGAEIDLLKRTVAKGTSDDEFAMFLWVCRKHKVDPVIGQIHCAMFPVKKHHKEKRPTQDGKGEIEVWIAGEQMVIMMGINGYRSLAARHHKDFGGCDEATHTFFDPPRKTPAGKLIPESTSIKLWKKGLDHPIVSTVYWEEFAPFDLGSDRADFWNRMPKHKLAVVAESHALRKGYPDLSDIYTEEEMDQKLQDYTEGGRLIVESDGRAPSGAPTGAYGVNTWRSQQPAIDAEVERQKRGEEPRSVEEIQATTAKQATAGAPTTAATPTGVRPAGGGSVQSSSLAGGFLGKIEVDWTKSKDNPIVRGDLTGEILESFKKHCQPEWGPDDWFHVPAMKVQVIREMCAAYRYEFIEIIPSKLPPNTQRGTDKLLPPKKKKESVPPAPPQLVKGTIDRVTSGMTSSNSPTRQVKIGTAWYTSYKNTIFEYLDKGLGRDAELFIDARKNIVGIKRIGAREFDSDGKTPIVHRDEPRGGNLFEK